MKPGAGSGLFTVPPLAQDLQLMGRITVCLCVVIHPFGVQIVHV